MRLMKLLVALCPVAVLCVPILAQPIGFTIAGFLKPQYTAPENAPSRVVIAGRDEPGERLIVTGRTLDGNKPVAAVSLYVFHTDSQGRYAPGLDNRAGEYNPRLYAALRTDAEGRYEYETT